MKYFRDIFPDYDCLFFADQENNPFGEKTVDEIKKITFDALHWFFDQGVALVILACNTAAACSIRAWQNQYPEKKVLSVTIPGIEALNKKNYQRVGVLATELTVKTWIYPELYKKYISHAGQIESMSAGELVIAVENNISGDARISLVDKYISAFNWGLDALILGCTHYSVRKDDFVARAGCEIIDPAILSVVALKDYLLRHPEINQRISKNNIMKFFTSGDAEKFKEIGKYIWGQEIKIVNKKL